MVAKSITHYTAPVLLVLSVMLAAGNWYLQPDRAAVWATTMLLLGAMGGALVLARKKEEAAVDAIRNGIVFAGLMLAVGLGAKLATALGAVEDAELSRRLIMVLTGGFFVFTGNAMPKTLTPLASLRCNPARVQAFQRLAGWTWVLMGLAFATAWLALPLDLAKPASTVVLITGMLTVAALLLRLRLRVSGHQSPTSRLN